MVLVGDWNLVMDQDKDTKFYNHIGNPRARQIVLDVMERENLVDVWRDQHAMGVTSSGDTGDRSTVTF